MSLDSKALQKLLIEMDNQLNKSRAELSMCNLQLEKIDTNLNIINLTSTKLSTLTKPEDSVWKGVGRAFVRTEVNDYLKKIESDKAEFLQTQKLLKTKQHYLETTLEKTIQNMSDIVGKR